MPSEETNYTKLYDVIWPQLCKTKQQKSSKEKNPEQYNTSMYSNCF